MTTESMDMSVRMTEAAVTALQGLPEPQREAVARAIRRVGIDEGTPIDPPVSTGGPYFAMVPDNDQAPVVVYQPRPKLEGGGYLITGLLPRDAYNTYTRAVQPGFFETPAGKAVLVGLAGLAIGIALGSLSGKGST